MRAYLLLLCIVAAVTFLITGPAVASPSLPTGHMHATQETSTGHQYRSWTGIAPCFSGLRLASGAG